MTVTSTEPAIVKTIFVRCGIETAFRTWTEQIHTWWPSGHSLSGRTDTKVFMEGKAHGRFYERTADGVEYDWGRVVIWDPPHQLTYDWFLGSGPERPSRVEVRFTAQNENQTRIDVRHRGPEFIGELWSQRSDGYRNAWGAVLKAFTAMFNLPDHG